MACEERGRHNPKGQTPTPSPAPLAPKNANIHWAPFSADTEVSRASFHQWIQSVPALASSSIPWEEATWMADDRIIIAIQSEAWNKVVNSLGYRSGVENPQLICTSWTGATLAQTIGALAELETAPLIKMTTYLVSFFISKLY